MPTLRRRKTDPGSGRRAPLRSSLAHAAWSVEDRVVWGTADAFRGLGAAVRWPFERAAWAIENWLVWPIQEETALWSRPVRAAVLAAVLLLAAAGVAAGILVSDPSSGTTTARPAASVQVTAPDARAGAAAALLKAKAAAARSSSPTAKTAAAAHEQVLHGTGSAIPTEHGGGVTKAQAATESSTATAGTAAAAEKPVGEAASAAPPASGSAGVAGPAAIKVAHRFADAFVLYETGHDDAKVKAIFHATATPDLAKALIQRPPRLPANVKVPQAKVLNVVAGPSHGDTYAVSVSLLRVGVTSELKLNMEKTSSGGGASSGESGSSSKQAGNRQWLVTDVVG